MESTPPPSAPTGPRPASKKRTETLRNARRLRSRCALSGDERQRKTAQPALWKRGERRGREELLHTKTAERRGDQNRGERDEEETGGERRGEERRGEERGAGIAVARSRHSGWPRTPAPAPCSGRALPQQRGQTRGEGRRRGDERKEEMRGGGKEKKSFLPRLLRPRLPESIIFGREETGRRGERRDEGREERQ